MSSRDCCFSDSLEVRASTTGERGRRGEPVYVEMLSMLVESLLTKYFFVRNNLIILFQMTELKNYWDTNERKNEIYCTGIMFKFLSQDTPG